MLTLRPLAAALGLTGLILVASQSTGQPPLVENRCVKL